MSESIVPVSVCGSGAVQVTLTAAPFEEAIASYKAAPNPNTLLSLNKAAIGYMLASREQPTWQAVTSEPLACTFTAIRVVVDRSLGSDDVDRVAGCLAYALTATLAGEPLGEPCAQVARSETSATTSVSFTCIEFAYDAARSTRTSPDANLAFDTARGYIALGTSLRTTDREGAGTRNTRLVEGLSLPANISFFVR